MSQNIQQPSVPPSGLLSSMSPPFQNSTLTGAGGQSPSFRSPNTQSLVIPVAPSKSAEEQWLETVVKPKSDHSENQPSNITQSQNGPRSSFLESMKSHKSQWSHMKEKSGMNSSVNFTTREFEDPYHPHPHPLEMGTQLPLNDQVVHPYTLRQGQGQGQTAAQLEAQKRMELMQREIDEVIGVMRLNFSDPCVVSPDRRLSELYHHCPEYDTKKWRCGGKEKEDAEERRKKRKQFWNQLCLIFGLLILIALFVAGDYFASSWFIGEESEALLKESRIRMAKRGNQTGGDGSGDGGTGRSLEGDDGSGGGAGTGDGGGGGTGDGGGGGTGDGGGKGNFEDTTVTVITQIEEEDIKAVVNEEDGDVDELINMAEEDDASLRRGHDVLEAAHVDEAEEEDTGLGLVASNPGAVHYQQRQMK